MDKSDEHIEQWYVIFKRTTLKHWVFRLIDRELQHCYAVKESPGKEFWIVVDGKNCFTDVRLESKLDYPHIRCIEPDGVILSVRAVIHPVNRHTLCVFTCVDVVKSLLGIKAFWCWTPYQLYKRLSYVERHAESKQNA